MKLKTMKNKDEMICPNCEVPLYIESWEGWRWQCAFCDYVGRVATHEESDKQQEEFEKYLKGKK